jgi:hypothetical protein
MVTTIPGDFFLLAQVFVSFYLISQIRRDWNYVIILKKVLIANFAFSIISIAIDAVLWPQTVHLGVFSAIFSLIWFFYFKRSKRVLYVFKEKQWSPEIFYPTVKAKV